MSVKGFTVYKTPVFVAVLQAALSCIKGSINIIAYITQIDCFFKVHFNVSRKVLYYYKLRTVHFISPMILKKWCLVLFSSNTNSVTTFKDE